MENIIRFLHTADLHLGAAVSSSAAVSSERRHEALMTLEKLFTICKVNEIPLMLIAGDLLENNSVEPRFFEGFLRCVNMHSDITVIFAAGNHDPLTADSPFLNTRLPENLIVLGPEDQCIELENLPVRIYGRSFGSIYMQGKNNFSIPAKNDEKLNIMVLHGETGTDLGGNYNTVTKSFIELSGMDYMALGHIHAFCAPQKIGSTFFAYSGTPEPHGFDELGLKGVIVGELKKDDLRYEFVPTAKRRYEAVEVDLGDAENSLKASEIIAQTLKEKFGNTYQNNFYKIILTGEIPGEAVIDAAEICTRLKDTLYFVKIRDNTRPAVDLEILKNENSLKGKFVKLMCEKISAADASEKENLQKAMYIGLKAFSSEVKYNEN